MKLTKAENVVLMSLVTQSIGIEAMIELLGKEKVEELDAVAVEMLGNTAPNEIALLGPIIIEKLVNKVLEIEKSE